MKGITVLLVIVLLVRGILAKGKEKASTGAPEEPNCEAGEVQRDADVPDELPASDESSEEDEAPDPAVGPVPGPSVIRPETPENGSRAAMDLHTVCTQFFELRLDGPTAEPRPWSRVNVLEEHEDRAASEYNVLDIAGHRFCLTGADHGHQLPILELATVWTNGSMTWVSASVLSHCAEALIEHGVRCGQRFSRQRGRLGQLRRTQSAQDLGSRSEFHRRHIRTMEVLDATSHSHGCTALDRRYPRTYNEAYPGRQPDAEEISRYRTWRRGMLESSSRFLPTVGQKCSVQAANAESDTETDRGQWRRPVREEASGEEGVQVADFVDDEAVNASDPPELGPRRRMGGRYVELRSSEESETYSDTEEASTSARSRKRKHKKRRRDD